ncbi:tetratricopeptide repeat protein [Candidatus Methylobacter oryzae]|uniref:Tetratricopeptide repeat protein n=2 Tax=Candidatus Methylobacter oryzae TaxID=2497749 RepID=A0ABY3CHF4_9GAMM|nr:tetratricopeptide repeat protein [Candidatus Methylobacter oryzae]
MSLRKFFLVLILLHSTSVFAIDKEMQGQFAQGLALIHDKNYVQATAVFSKLTKEYPTFPEPYNNLAYIYAVQGNYIKAQDILQSAFKNNPSYALVYENLNAIYAEIARGIYEKELGAKDSNREPLKNLYIIDHLFDKTENKITTVIKAADKDNINSIENTNEKVVSPTSISTTPSAYAPLSEK